jgi:hypothetical protein
MPSLNFSKSDRCIYCGNVSHPLTDDHIFPRFLGGRATVPACRTCNSIFGHTFEAETSRQLLPFHVFISGIGLLPLRSTDPTWKEALEVQGRKYNLRVAGGGVEASITHPSIQRDEQGRIVAAQFRTEAEARRFAESLVAKGKAKTVSIEEAPGADLGPQLYGSAFTMGSALRRLALKMCFAAYTLLPEPEIEEGADARSYLTGTNKDDATVECVRTALADYTSLDALRRGLSHVVYVERTGDRIYGVVQFFGFLQLYCRLGPSIQSKPAAVLCTLDPVNGEECTRETPALGLDEPPSRYLRDTYVASMYHWLAKQRREIIERGGRDADFGPLEISFS